MTATDTRSLADQLQDPNHPTVREALTRRCDQCQADIGAECKPRGGIHHDLAGRIIHLGRMQKP